MVILYGVRVCVCARACVCVCVCGGLFSALQGQGMRCETNATRKIQSAICVQSESDLICAAEICSYFDGLI